MTLDIETNIEDLKADFKKANSIDNIRSAEELEQLYGSSNYEAFKKVRRRFQTCFNHLWVTFHYKNRAYDLINKTNCALECVIVKAPLAFDVRILSLGWLELGSACLQNNLKDVAIECLLISSLMERLIPEYERFLIAVKILKKNTLMNQLIPGIWNGGRVNEIRSEN